MMPNEPSRSAPPAPSEALAAPIGLKPRGYRWYHKLSAVLLVTFCVEVGLFLLVFPWTDYWDNNYLLNLFPEWRQYWSNTYLRGAVSGLGVVNLYISIVEIFRLRRFSRRTANQ